MFWIPFSCPSLLIIIYLRSSDYLIESIGKYFPYRILNFHGGKLRTNFLCDIVPNAPASCALSRSMDQFPEAKANPEQTLFYDAIVTAAADKGWIDKTQYRRPDVAQGLRDYFEKMLKRSPTDLPQSCPPDSELEVLLEASIAKEKKLMPHLSEDDHRRAFHEAKMKQKFCWIDTERVLEQPELRNYFKGLQAQAI